MGTVSPLRNPNPANTDGERRKALGAMNAKYCVVSEGGKVVVLGEVQDPALSRYRVDRYSFADIGKLHHRPVREETEDSSKMIPLGKWWLSHPERRQYDGVVFNPGDPSLKTADFYNLFRGLDVEPQPGDWSLYRQHLEENVCAGDQVLIEYVTSWIAHCFQHPWEKPGTALVLRSEERGTGKSLFARYIRQAWGQHGIELSNPEHVIGRFNAHLEDCLILVLNEAFWAGSHNSESVLKTLVTEPHVMIERKGFDPLFKRSYLRVILTSNSEWVVPAGIDERRFVMLEVSPGRKRDTAFFGDMVKQMENGGLAAMVYDLLRHDLSSVDLRQAPETAALVQQKLKSMSPQDRWLFDLLFEGDNWCVEVSKPELYGDYCEALERSGTRRRCSSSELGSYLSKVFGSELSSSRPRSKGSRARFYCLPDLDKARAIFEERLGAPFNWPTEIRSAPAPKRHIRPREKKGKVVALLPRRSRV